LEQIRLHKLDSFKCDGFYVRNIYTLDKESKKAAALPTVTAKAGQLLYHYDVRKHPFLKEKIAELKEISRKAVRYVGCDPGFANLAYFQELIPDEPGSESFRYGNRWRYTRGEDIAHRRYKKYLKLEDRLKKSTCYSIGG
jgi:hypothetical protein